MTGAEAGSPNADRAVRLWLLAVAALVFVMIVVGGATRLTDSGLSITEWQPIMGAIPPLSDAAWQEAFARYKEIPEYHLVNKGMSLEDFKFIFWWEWGHRFLGRLIGVAFAFPFVLFWFRGMIRPGLAPKLAGILALGALQGAMGWFMVQSGLVDRVDVSHYRLALHLGLAFVIFAVLLWVALDLSVEAEIRNGAQARGAHARLAGAIVAIIFVQVMIGALVAGLKAGLLHNTWPLMDGALVPEGLWALEPWYLNLTDNETMVQFIHRLVAYVVTGLTALQAVRVLGGTSDPRARQSISYLAVAVALQVGLGIATLLAAVPLSLALVHQAGAAVVLGLAVLHLHAMLRVPAERACAATISSRGSASS